ncbi:HET-domain-containing protein [Colletotrichum sublineola]|nr:HET-domain-containing protein [Colletotrichum sublineola]
MKKPLDNNWEYKTDEECARSIVARNKEINDTVVDSLLCQRCRALEIWSESCEFTDSLADLETRQRSCDLCRILYRSLLRRAARSKEIVKFLRSGSSLTLGEKHWNPILSLCTTEDSDSLRLNNVQLGFPSQLDPGSKTHADILLEWVKTCDNRHPLPVDEPFLPTRLLAVGNEQGSRVQLICSSNQGIPKTETYVALSHRWGSPDQKQPPDVRFASTTKENINTIMNGGVDDVDLPKTFRDAVTMTRKLRIPYLWIDSLCIMQKSGKGEDEEAKADWEREAKLMERVFSSAYLTIAASCAEHKFHGFLHPRILRQTVTMRADDGARFHVCEVIDNFDLDVEQGELNKRAWVLQERALSRRTIHFTQNQTYWECGEGIRCETFTKTENRKASFLGDSNFPYSVKFHKQGRQLQHYQGLYERYSTLGLSYDTDRPMAISGLEKRLMSALESAGGFGVFQTNFHRDLLWQRRNSESTLKRIDFGTANHAKIPSWSWMAYSGEIRYMNVPFDDILRADDIQSPFQALSPGVSYTDADPWGRAELRAPVHTIAVQKPDWLILDEPERQLVRPLRCVIVGKSKHHKTEQPTCYVLVVSPAGKEGNKHLFERVGVAYLRAEEIVCQEATVVSIR